MTSFLVCQPGASFAIADVYRGLCWGLKENGHQIRTYNLDARMEFSKRWLQAAFRHAKKQGRPASKPTDADVQYHAGTGVLERALGAEPEIEWVIIVSGMYILPAWLKLLKRAGRKIGVLFTESPYNDFEQAHLLKFADIAWTHERTSLDRLKTFALTQGAGHVPIYYLPHAYNPKVHFPDGTFNAGHDVAFVGTGFPERVELLQAVKWNQIDLGLYGTWTSLGSKAKLRRHVRGGPIDNRQAVDIYRQARIGLNLHRQSVGYQKGSDRIRNAESLNPRAYELAACGLFHVSDFRQELTEIFGGLVPTFGHPAELLKLVLEWLAKPERERMERGKALAEAVRPHHWAARAEQMVRDLSRVGAAPRSAAAMASI